MREPVNGEKHFPVLDGVRAFSIILVLVTHLAPVRLGAHGFNSSVGMLGMALFFCLSGFLITRQILEGIAFHEFVARRLLRVVPVAWLCIVVVSLFNDYDPTDMVRNFLFVANLPPQTLMKPLDHFWSLNLEVQFYLLAALVLLVRRDWIWYVLPLLLAAVITLRVVDGVTASSVTWYRVDDLLAGGCLALFLSSGRDSRAAWWLSQKAVCVALTVLLGWSCLLYPGGGENHLAYLRAPFVGLWLGSVMLSPSGVVRSIFCGRRLAYVAAISYALYVWHLPLAATWLGSGDLVEKYAKRPLLIAVLVLVSHFSTFYFERIFTRWGRRIFAPSPIRT